MKRVFILTLVLFSLISITRPAFAEFDSFQASPWTQETTYMDKIIHKLGFGILNGGTGWTSLFFEPTRHKNIFAGVIKGCWRTVTNTVGGILHAATFPIPIDIPLPDGGVSNYYDDETAYQGAPE